MNTECFFVAKNPEDRKDIKLFEILTRILNRAADYGEVYPVCIDEIQQDEIKILPNRNSITLEKGDLLYFVGGKDYYLNKRFFNEFCVLQDEMKYLAQFNLISCEDKSVSKKLDLITEKTIYTFEDDTQKIPYDGLGLEIIDDVLVYVSNYWKNNVKDSVTLPDGIKRIGNRAFNGCKNIVNLIVPEGVEEIGESAFSMCNNLKTVVLPKSLKKISDFAFAGCFSLETVKFDSQFLKNSERKPLGRLCFSKCQALDQETFDFLKKFEATHTVSILGNQNYNRNHSFNYEV